MNKTTPTLSQQILGEQDILAMLKKDRDGTTARYFAKIESIDQKLEEHCRQNGQYQSKLAKYRYDITMGIIGVFTLALTAYLKVRGVI